MKIRSTIERLLKEQLNNADIEAPNRFDDQLVLLESGLDSLAFAILVTQLEDELGYDPFTMMDEAVYPTTFGEFVEIYERFAPTT